MAGKSGNTAGAAGGVKAETEGAVGTFKDVVGRFAFAAAASAAFDVANGLSGFKRHEVDPLASAKSGRIIAVAILGAAVGFCVLGAAGLGAVATGVVVDDGFGVAVLAVWAPLAIVARGVRSARLMIVSLK